MIYQFYNQESQRAQCFGTSVYKPFPMSPLVNPQMLALMPEIADSDVEAQAREGQGFFLVARQIKRDHHPWVGFTSWRQLDKRIPFQFKGDAHVDSLFKQAPVLAWNVMGHEEKVWTQGEIHHPGLKDYFQQVHERTPKIVTAKGLEIYEQRSMKCFPWASYVAMSWDLFDEFIDTLLPEWEYMVANHKTDPYLSAPTFSPPRYVGGGHKPGGQSAAWSAFFERYVGVWINQKGLPLLGLRRGVGQWTFVEKMS